MGEHRFVRCILLLPLQGSDLDFGFGVWGTLSPAKDPYFSVQIMGLSFDRLFEIYAQCGHDFRAA